MPFSKRTHNALRTSWEKLTPIYIANIRPLQWAKRLISGTRLAFITHWDRVTPARFRFWTY